MKKIIVVAGATGNLGMKIVQALQHKGASVRALVRADSDSEKVKKLEQMGASIFRVDMLDVSALANVCKGADCVLSALSGLEDVIIKTQKALLDAAVLAAVPRFIPSDFSLDFTNLKRENRNLDWRRNFHKYLDNSPIAATSIFIGPFMDLLVGDMPMILFKQKRVLYWGNADQRLDFTTIENTANFAANVALDDNSPRFLKVAGDRITVRELAGLLSELRGQKFRLLRAGGLGLLRILIKVAKTMAPGKNELYPAWQGMQYMRDMMEGKAEIAKYDNDRYQDMSWTTVKEMLTNYYKNR